KCTPQHPFFVWRQHQRQEVEAAAVHPSDLLLYPDCPSSDFLDFNVSYNSRGREKGTGINDASLGTVPVGIELARLLGLFLAEGHASPDHIAFTFGNTESPLIEFTRLTLETLFHRDTNITGTWATQVRLSIRQLSTRFREWFGHGARNKRVPDFVFSWNLQNRLAFLKGFFDGDGCYQAQGCVFTSASRALIEGIIGVGNSCGLMFAAVSERRTESSTRYS